MNAMVLAAANGEWDKSSELARQLLEEDEDNEMIDLESLFDDTLGKGSTAWWRDEISGCPSSLDETVADLLASGFSPLNSPICATKLREVFKNKLRAFRDKLKILIPDSAMAFIVPGMFFTTLSS